MQEKISTLKEYIEKLRKDLSLRNQIKVTFPKN